MADYTITINNSIQMFGLVPPNVWGTFLWGDNWGYGTDLITHTEKVLNENISLSDTISFAIIKSLSFGQLSINADMGSEQLTDSNGYYHVFRGNTTEGETRISTNYTEDSSTTSSWSSVSSPSTTWS